MRDYDPLLDAMYRISLDPPDYDTCLRIPMRAGCFEQDIFMVPVEPDYDMEHDARDLVMLLDELLGYAEGYSTYLAEKWDLRSRTEAWIVALGIGDGE